MSRRRRKERTQKRKAQSPSAAGVGILALYERACGCASAGQTEEAQRIYGILAKDLPERRLSALVCNDRATLAALAGDCDAALRGFREALAIDPQCEVARFNLTFLEDELAEAAMDEGGGVVAEVPARPGQAVSAGKLAILSFLFNWPSSGGGNVHTAELAHFLARAGYTVRHFYARYPAWGIGNIGREPLAEDGLWAAGLGAAGLADEQAQGDGAALAREVRHRAAVAGVPAVRRRPAAGARGRRGRGD
jgi:tetratricopeptide (TPR) repeat protein